jgi:hypothetical protein
MTSRPPRRSPRTWRWSSLVRVDLACERGVYLQFLSLGCEVVVGLGALKLCLAVLADHDERRQEDGLERDDEVSLGHGSDST